MTTGRRRTRPCGCSDDRADPLGIAQPELQSRIGAHAPTNDMGVVDAKSVHDGADVIDRTLPAVGRRILGNVTRRIATCIVGDAAICARKVASLVFPLTQIRSEFVSKNDWVSFAVLLQTDPPPCTSAIWH